MDPTKTLMLTSRSSSEDPPHLQERGGKIGKESVKSLDLDSAYGSRRSNSNNSNNSSWANLLEQHDSLQLQETINEKVHPNASEVDTDAGMPVCRYADKENLIEPFLETVRRFSSDPGNPGNDDSHVESHNVYVADVIITGIGKTASEFADKLKALQSERTNSPYLNIIFKSAFEFLGISFPVVKFSSQSTFVVCLDPQSATQKNLEPFKNHIYASNQFDDAINIVPIVLSHKSYHTHSEANSEGVLEGLNVELDKETDICSAYEKLMAESSAKGHPIPASLVTLHKKCLSFISADKLPVEDVRDLVMRNDIVILKEASQDSPDASVIYVQPKNFETILLVPRLHEQLYLTKAAEINSVDRHKIKEALDEGIICGRSLIKTMQITLYQGVGKEDSCLNYFLKHGVILRTPAPDYVKKNWKQKIQWFFNPFVVGAKVQPIGKPIIMKGSRVLSRRLTFHHGQPTDFYNVACSILHELCTPNTIHVSSYLSWGKCNNVSVIFQRVNKEAVSLKKNFVLYNLENSMEDEVYVSVTGPESAESQLWIMNMAIKEALDSIISRWMGIKTQVVVDVACPTIIDFPDKFLTWTSHEQDIKCKWCNLDNQSMVDSVRDNWNKLNHRNIEVVTGPQYGSTGNFGNSSLESEQPTTIDGQSTVRQKSIKKQLSVDQTAKFGRRDTGYDSLSSQYSTSCSTRPDSVGRQLSFEVIPDKEIDTSMSFKDMQLSIKFMSMNNVCCIGKFYQKSPTGKLVYRMYGTGMLIHHDKATDTGIILTALHVMKDLQQRDEKLTGYLSFDYNDYSLKPNITHDLGEFQEVMEELDIAFVTIHKTTTFIDHHDVEMVDFNYLLVEMDTTDVFWKREQRLFQIGHSGNSVKSTEICRTENRITMTVSTLLNNAQSDAHGDFDKSLSNSLVDALSPRNLRELKILVDAIQEFFKRQQESTSDIKTICKELLSKILVGSNPFCELKLLLPLERILVSSDARWGASGSPVISTQMRGGALVAMYLRGFPDSAKTGEEFMVEQAVKMPTFQVVPAE